MSAVAPWVCSLVCGSVFPQRFSRTHVGLIGEGLGMHIPKGYIYFAMGFLMLVEVINLQVRRLTVPVQLHEPYV